MKSLIKAAVVATVLAIPAVSFAQQQQPVSRAQVRSDLVEARAAGYNPSDWLHYPENVQTVQTKIAAAKATQAYGPTTNGTSQSGQ